MQVLLIINCWIADKLEKLYFLLIYSFIWRKEHKSLCNLGNHSTIELLIQSSFTFHLKQGLGIAAEVLNLLNSSE